jgi:hypothetical protein
VKAGRRQNNAACFDDLAAAAGNELTALEALARGHEAEARWWMDRAALRLLGIYRDPSRELRELLAREGWDSAG